MRKNQIRNIVIHNVTDELDQNTLAVNVNEFYAGMIEHRLSRSGLTAEQKLIVIDRIIENFKSREINGIIE
ncbi:MAG: hypothetical protein FWH14_02360 [Oscillospiraceae bacterium]|nr:hypothetical protein [Oscillospiraceae bacterium]